MYGIHKTMFCSAAMFLILYAMSLTMLYESVSKSAEDFFIQLMTDNLSAALQK